MICPVNFQWQEIGGPFPAYAWPGGYQLFYVFADGATCCPKCANGVKEANITPDTPEDWRIIAQEVNYENANLYCDVCEKRIPSAYAEED